MQEYMETFATWLKTIGINPGLLLSGSLGGFISTNKVKHLPFWERVLIVSAAAFCANYLTPIVIGFLNWEGDSLYGLGFIIGYLGLSTLELVAIKVHSHIEKHQTTKNGKSDN